MPDPMIKAKAHSDDYAVEVKFDAEKWLAQATDQEIIDLVRREFGGDYPADDVAIASADWSEELASMFTYIEARSRVETIGFECHVDENDAIAWIKANRPSIALNMDSEDLEGRAIAVDGDKWGEDDDD